VEQASGRNCCPWREAHERVGFLAAAVACGGHTGAVIPEGVCLMERIHSGAVCGELQPVGRTHNREFQKQSVMK